MAMSRTLLMRSFGQLQRCTRQLIVNQSAKGRHLCTSNKLYDQAAEMPPELPKKRKTPRESPITMKTLGIGATVGGAFLAFMLYLQNEKDKVEEKNRRRMLGKAQIGGAFELSDPNGKLVKSTDFLGKWVFIYFGFTHCPDVCPDELEKLTSIVDSLEEKHNIKAQPIFISVDPDRDTPAIVGKYIKEFSDKFIGLTGTVEQTAQVCKAFRVYYSNGPKDQDADYIVDHTIIIYLIDPEGNFVDYYGQTNTAQEIVKSTQMYKMRYDAAQKKDGSWLPSLPFKEDTMKIAS